MPINAYDDLLQTGKVAPANPYDELLNEQTQDKTVAVKSSMQAAVKTSPDAKAKSLEIANRLRVPIDLVERNPDLFTARDAIERIPYDDLIRDSPELTTWLQDPTHAAVSHDDLRSLSGIERLLGVGRNVAGAAAAGVFGFSQGIWGALQAGAESVDAQAETTPLTPWDEQAFQAWVRANQSAPGVGTFADAPYDMRGFWMDKAALAGWRPGDHFPDTYKQHGHPTFSVESKYSKGPQDGGRWEGETYIPPATFDDSGMTPQMSAAYQQVLRKYSGLPPIKAIRANPNLRGAKLDGQFVGDGVIELNPDVTDPAKLEALILHELRHAAGGNEIAANKAEVGWTTLPTRAPGLAGRLATFAAGSAAVAGVLADKMRGAQEGAGFTERAAYSGIESLGQMAPALALGILTGPTALLASFGVTTGGQAYTQARAQGVPVSKSALFGSIQGAVEVATEFIPAHLLLKDLALKSPLVKTLAHLIASEIPGEEVATVLQDLNEWAVLPENKTRTLGDYLRARPSAAAATAISTLVSVGATTTVGHATAKVFEQLGAVARESKTVQRAPDAVNALIEQATRDGPTAVVYAPVETWQTYWQSKNANPKAIAELLGVGAAVYDLAVQTGHDLPLSTAKYATTLAATDHNAFFANELRLAPNHMNAREAEAFQVDLAKMAAEDAGPAGAPPAPTEAIRTALMAQLEGAGVPRATAEQYATLYESAFQSLGERAGVSPEALYQRYGLTVGRSSTAALDTAPIAAQTTGDVTDAAGPRASTGATGRPAFRRVAPSAPTRRESAKQYAVRRAEHYGDIVSQVLDAARTVDPTVDVATVQKEFDDRVALLEDLDAEFKEAGHDPRSLLESIATYGGLSLAAESGTAHRLPGYAGELKWLRDSPALGPFGSYAGVRGVFQKRDVSGSGLARQGLSLDDMLQMLRQDPQYQYLESINDLLAALEDVARLGDVGVKGVELPGTEELQRRAGVNPAVAWWKGETGFNQEEQPALPGAEHVRDQEIATPQLSQVQDDQAMAAAEPFALTPESVQRTEIQQTLFQDERGRIVFGKDRQFQINLLEHADLSTFLHESGHFFLEVLRDLANDPHAAPELRADLATLDEWFFTDEDATRAIGEKQHEQFARGFEAYLMEGKAPSVALRAVFARFRAWLVGVYRSLKGLNVNLTPEVRAVFDRLLATDAAIAQAESEAQIAPLFTDAASAGMTEPQFAQYRETVAAASLAAQETLQTQLLADVQREQTAQWKAQRDAIRSDVEKDVSTQPVYQALTAIRTGTYPDGESLTPGQPPVPLKLSRAAIVAQFGEARLKTLPKPYVYTVDGGLEPGQAAELFGFSSGDELLTAIAQAPSMKHAIETETDRRMLAAHGSLLLDGTLPEKAMQAVQGEHRQAVIQAELAALTKGIAQGVIPPASVIRTMAATRIAGTRVRDLRAGHFLMAAQRASQRAFDLLTTNKDRVVAVQAKQQELINLALYREATRAREDADARVAAARKLDTPASRTRIGLAGESYQDQIDGVLDRYDFARVSLKALDRRASLRKWVAALEGEGLPVDLPEELLDDARRVNYQDLTYEELVGVTDGLKQIAHLARLKNRLLKAAGKRELTEAVTTMTSSIVTHAKGTRDDRLEVRLPQDRAARTVSSWFAAHRKLSSFLREMDGWHDGGAMWEAILRPINEAANAETVRNAQETQTLAELFDAAFAGRETELYRKAFIPAISRSLSKMGRIVVALNRGNEGNQQRLRGGFHWTDEQIRAVTDTLDARDWAFVQAIWTHFESFRPEIAAKERHVNGVEPQWVEPTPVSTPFGELTGGYFPIMYENQLSARASANLEGSFADSIKQASYVRATTRRGHLEARQAKVSEPLRLDFGVITEHVSQVIHDLTHHEMLIDVGRLLSQRAVQDAIYAHYGDVVYEQIKGTIRDVAWGTAPAPAWYRPLNHFRQGVVTASLGWNLITSALQPFQVTNGMVRVGPTWVLKGYVRWMRNAASMESTAGWIAERSDFMKTRGLTQLREINELRNRIGLDRGRVSGWIHDALHSLGVDATHMPVIADSYFYIIQKGQQLADIPTWLGAYEKAMADETNDENRAVALADQAVIDSQASGHIKDLAAVERQPLLKILTTFYSYQNLLLNQSVEVVKRTNFKSPAQMGRLGIDAALLLFAPSAISYFIHAAVSGGGDDDDNASLAERLLRHQLSDLFGLFVGVREISGTFEGYPYEGPAGMRYVSTIARAGNQIAQGELDAPFWRSLNQSAGILFHYPATQVQRTAEGFNALMEGQTANPLVLLTGPKKE